MTSQPHGGILVDRILKGEAREAALRRAADLPTLDLTERQAREVENIAIGVYSPLAGFMKKADLDAVLDRNRLAGGAACRLGTRSRCGTTAGRSPSCTARRSIASTRSVSPVRFSAPTTRRIPASR
jgi:hypothetical protein